MSEEGDMKEACGRQRRERMVRAMAGSPAQRGTRTHILRKSRTLVTVRFPISHFEQSIETLS